MFQPVPKPVVRALQRSDLDRLVELMAQHAAYERAAFSPQGKARRLAGFLFGPQPRARCLVAVVGEKVVGFTTFAKEFSTWDAAEYLHMDTLFVEAGYRSAGIGQMLLDAVHEAAGRDDVVNIQWQTPDWNEGAIRFYQRIGALGSAKVRFTLRPQRSVELSARRG